DGIRAKLVTGVQTCALPICAGVLPALVAERARAERWRVVAFTFDGATDLSARVARTIPSRLREFGPILTALKDEGVSAAVLVGRSEERRVGKEGRWRRRGRL